MRINKLFSTIFVAFFAVLFAASIMQAQTGGTVPDAAEQPAQPTYDAQQKFLPPVAKTSRRAADNVQQVGFQESDVKVPPILGGQRPKTDSTPAAGEVASQETADTPQTLPELKTVHPPEIQSFQDLTIERGNWQRKPLRNVNVVAHEAEETKETANSTIATETGEDQNQTNLDRTASIQASDSSPYAQQNASDNATITTSAPNILVQAIGPKKISINKTAKYEIHITNQGNRPAQNLIVGIDFPTFIEINDSQPTIGTREITDGSQESRMIWNLPIVEPQAVEKIVMDLTPTEARQFEVDVEWTFLPIQGKTTVDVTEPKLSIQIAGPAEVQFGEKALYHVTVANPGTGTAENVSVMLPEALGGERATLGLIEPAQQKQFQVELIARSAGVLELTTTVTADGNLSESDSRNITVRRAALDVEITGPQMKYAGSSATYQLTVTNTGDAMAKDVVAAIALPRGVEYVSGVDTVENIDGGIRWNVGMLSAGNERTYEINCTVNLAGEVQIEAAARGAGDLAAIDSIVTKVEAIADLVLAVHDPKGPLPTGQDVDYEIRIRNRGTKAARDVKILMQFADGIEPLSAKGLTHELMTGQVVFTPISQIDPNQEVILTVVASAHQPGVHRFRAQLVCEESDAHEVSEGTTKFFGESGVATERSADEDDGQFRR